MNAPQTLLDQVTMERRELCTIFVGRKARLIALGICNEHHFPTGRKRSNYPGRLGPNSPATPGHWHIAHERGDIFKFTAQRIGPAPYWPDVWASGSGAEKDVTPCPKTDERARLSEAMRAGFRAAGIAAAMADAYEMSPARFHIGDRAILCSEADENETAVEIVEDYGCHNVRGEGRRLGYVVRAADGDSYFAPAGILRKPDHKVSHLYLLEARA